MLLYTYVGPNVSLTLVSADDVLELDSGEFSIARACFTANFIEPLNRAASFYFIFSSLSTANLENDYYIASSPFITIPIFFTGNFTRCIEVEVIGDNIMEDDETVVIEFLIQAISDTVTFPGNSNLVVMQILNDNDVLGTNFTNPAYNIR